MRTHFSHSHSKSVRQLKVDVQEHRIVHCAFLIKRKYRPARGENFFLIWPAHIITLRCRGLSEGYCNYTVTNLQSKKIIRSEMGSFTFYYMLFIIVLLMNVFSLDN